MSTKKVIASYVVELTEDENGYRLITVTLREPFVDSFALPATGTLSDTLGTIRKLSKEVLNTFGFHQRYRC